MNSRDYSTDPEESSRLKGYLPPGYWPPPTPKETDEHGQPVDQVAIRKLGGFNFVSPAQWNAMDREHQRRLIQEGAVTFLYQGAEVSIKAALLTLKALRDGTE